MDHMGRLQDQGWHLGGKVKEMPFCEGNGLQALHLWDKIETRVEGWHCYLPLKQIEAGEDEGGFGKDGI